MEKKTERPPTPMLSWRLKDFERMFFFPGSGGTHANTFLALLFSLVATTGFFVLITVLRERYPTFAAIWLERGWVQYAVAMFFFWGLAVVFIKWRKLLLQRLSLNIKLVPDDPGFVLSPRTADDVLRSLNTQVDDPDAFILFSRVKRAVLSLRNIGRVSEVQVIVQAQSDGDANSMESSYTLVKGFLWAMPVLGFIGTVQGLSAAIGKFGTVLSQNTEMSGLRDSLKGVVLGLSVAFDTTLVALVCTLILQLLVSYLRKKEEEFLGDCDDYCHRDLVSKLRLLGHEASDQ